MMSWLEAHRVANLAAAQAHGDLGINTDCYPIDVYRALTTAGIELMWQPMPRLFGAYVNEPRAKRGVLLNAGLPPAAQRHTAAHELGHYQLGHGTRLDEDLDPAERARAAGWSTEERLA